MSGPERASGRISERAKADAAARPHQATATLARSPARPLSRSGLAGLVPLAVVAMAALAPLLLDNQFYLLLIQVAGIYYIAALGLNLVLGYAGQVSLGHAALMGVGAYTSAILTLRQGQPFLVGLAAAAIAAGLVGVLLGVPALRMAGPYLAMATMAFNLIVHRLTVNWAELTGGPDGLPGIPAAALGPLVLDRQAYFYLVLAFGVAAYLLTRNLVASRYGRGWMALRDDETAAACMGVDLYANKLAAFAVGAVYAGIAGSLFAHLYRHISPISFGLEASIDLLLVVILGGMGTVGWPLAGALILTVLPQLPALHALQDARLLVYGAILLLSVMVFRRGLAGVFGERGSGGGGEGGKIARAGWRRQAVARNTALRPPVSSSPARPLAPSPTREPSPPPPLPPSPTPESSPAREPAPLAIRGVSKRFGGTQALADVDMLVEAGSIHGLIGPNGSGKTTLVNVISGLVRPDKGSLALGGVALTRMPPHRIAGLGVARTFQAVRLFGEMTVRDNVLVGRHLQQRPWFSGALFALPGARRLEAEGRERARALLATVGLEGAESLLPHHLSHGDQRGLELARALAARPRLLLLDEPAAGLSEEEVARLRQLIPVLRSTGLSVLLIEHRMELVMGVCDTVTVLDYGRVIARGTPEQVQNDPAVIEAYLGRERSRGAAAP